MINTINIPDMIDQILYPESASAASGATDSEPGAASESDKKLNELVNGAVIDSADVDDDSAGKLIVVIYISTTIY